MGNAAEVGDTRARDGDTRAADQRADDHCGTRWPENCFEMTLSTVGGLGSRLGQSWFCSTQ